MPVVSALSKKQQNKGFPSMRPSELLEGIPVHQLLSEKAVRCCLAGNILACRDMEDIYVAKCTGYAIARDVLHHVPAVLKEIGISTINHPHMEPIAADQTMLVHSGALLPEGIDLLIPSSFHPILGSNGIEVREEEVVVHQAPVSHAHSDKLHSQCKRGDILFPLGHVLSQADIALLHLHGINEVPVFWKEKAM